MTFANLPSKKIVVAASALVLLLAAVTVALVTRDRGGSSFRRGGQFVATGAPEPTTVGTTEPPVTSTTILSPGTSLVAPGTTVRRVVPATVRPPATPGPSASGPGAVPPPGPPALGTYRWNVIGTESATAFGSRSLPPTMTMAVHSAPGLGSRQVVADLTYSSEHTEREILDFRDDGVYLSYEAGEVKFGLGSQTNQGDYSPPMLQVPLPLSAGTARSGASEVRDAGKLQRAEDWTARIAAQETITVAGNPTPTWRVTIDRQSRPGASQQVTRSRTYWFDPARHLWVKFTERVHGEQGVGVLTFSYDASLTANLASFAG